MNLEVAHMNQEWCRLNAPQSTSGTFPTFDFDDENGVPTGERAAFCGDLCFLGWTGFPQSYPLHVGTAIAVDFGMSEVCGTIGEMAAPEGTCKHCGREFPKNPQN